MQYCPRTIALRRGKVVYDGPSAALTPPLLKTLYGDDARELLDEPAQDADGIEADNAAGDTPLQNAASTSTRYAFAHNPAHSN
jgi:phosphonate transport system ATP-binding protein